MNHSADSSPIFWPYKLRGLELPNRMVVSPMCQYSAEDGIPNDWHLVHLGSRAIGGAGLIIAEMSGVSPIGRITPGCTGMYSDEHVEAWRRITDFIHERSGSKIGIQLGHAGRKASTKPLWQGQNQPLETGNWNIIAPSPEPYGEKNQVPKAMDQSIIDEVVTQFGNAAERVADAGFDMIEIHGAHGYLISGFMSPVSNKRTDDYGGDLANRMRFPLQVVDAVRAVLASDFPLGVRISAIDGVEGGNTGEDAVEISRMFKAHGVDYITASAGGINGWSMIPRPEPLGYVPFARRIKHEAGIATMAVGNINTVEEVEGILRKEDADLIALARGHLRDSYWSLHASQNLGMFDGGWPDQYVAVPRQDSLWRKDRNAAGESA
jgi:anthraniloyl-CoA monooxygenase